MAGSAGSVALDIIPDLDGLGRDIISGLEGMGSEVEQAVSTQIEGRIRTPFAAEIDSALEGVKTSSAAGGEEIGSGITTSIRDALVDGGASFGDTLTSNLTDAVTTAGVAGTEAGAEAGALVGSAVASGVGDGLDSVGTEASDALRGSITDAVQAEVAEATDVGGEAVSDMGTELAQDAGDALSAGADDSISGTLSNAVLDEATQAGTTGGEAASAAGKEVTGKFKHSIQEGSVESSASAAEMGVQAGDAARDAAVSQMEAAGAEAGQSFGFGFQGAAPEVEAETGASIREIMATAGEEAGAAAATAGREAAVKFGEGARESLKSLGGALFQGIAIFGGAELVKGSLEEADDEEAAVGKLKNMFGEASEQAEAFGESAAKGIGQSALVADTALGKFGQLFRSYGEGADEAEKQSEQIVTLSADLSKFNNIPVDQVQDNIVKALRGSSNAMRQYGVDLSASTLAAEALSHGIVQGSVDQGKLTAAQDAYNLAVERQTKVDGDANATAADKKAATDAVAAAQQKVTDALGNNVPKLDANQKSEAAYYAILDQTKNAQGAYADSAGTMATQHQKLAAEVDDLKAKLGEQLMPVVLKIGDVFLHDVVPAFQSVAHWIGENKAVIEPLAIAAGVAFLAFEVGTKTFAAFNAISKTFAGTLKLLGISMGEATVATEAETGAAVELDAAMDANPIGLIVAAIALLVLGFIELYKHSKLVRDIVGDIGDFFKAAFKDSIQVAVDIWHGLVDAFHWAVDAGQKVWDFLKQWGPAILAIVFPFIGIPLLIKQHWGEIVDFFKDLFGKIVGFFEDLPGNALKALGAVGDWFKSIGSDLLNAGKWILSKIWDGLKDLAKLPGKIYDYVVGQGGLIGIGEKIGAKIYEALKSGLNKLLSIGRDIVEGIDKGAVAVWDWLKALPAKILGYLIGFDTWLLKKGEDLLTGLVNGITTGAEDVWDFFKNLPLKIYVFLVNIGIWLLVHGENLLHGLRDGIVHGAEDVWNFFTALPGKVASFLAGVGTWLLDKGRSLLSGMVSGITTGAVDVWNFFTGLPGKVEGFFSAAGTWLLSAGKNIVEGIWNGISGAAGWLWSKIKDFTGGIVSHALSFLGIKSPSTVFRDEVGQWIPKGIAVGMLDHAHHIDAAGDALARRAVMASKAVGSAYATGMNISATVAQGISVDSDQTIKVVMPDGRVLAQVVNNQNKKDRTRRGDLR